MASYFIADTHFGHKSILNFDHRPFCSLEEMEEVMVMNWNAAVCQNDTVYILGDFCWGKQDEWLRLLKRLRGKKVLIRGNHDLKQYPPELAAHFVGIYDYHVVAENGRKIVLCHYPILLYENSGDPRRFMLCGHVHTTVENAHLERWTTELRRTAATRSGPTDFANLGQIYNVGAMMPWMNYTPRTLDEILKRHPLGAFSK